MGIEINFEQAKALLEYFGGEDADVTVQHMKNGHSGRGLYCWCSDYPEDGADFLGASEIDKIISEHDDAKGDPQDE